jgi:thymidylate synthase
MTNYYYQNILHSVLNSGDKLMTRNAEVISCIDLPNTRFTEFPLVTIRKTAAMKAISEMEWFMSGESKCPDHLLDWWKGQLNKVNYLYDGYSHQFRRSTTRGYDDGTIEEFDQVAFILKELKAHSNSRRLIMSVWNPGEMSDITCTNNNPNTPTCCHSIVVQFFVREGRLHMKTYQRSADLLLGVPHNWVQSWAMLLYFAHHAGLQVGSMTWMWGDAHIYQEESHMLAAEEIINAEAPVLAYANSLVYEPKEVVLDNAGVPIFKASDFRIVGTVPEPLVTSKINLL